MSLDKINYNILNIVDMMRPDCTNNNIYVDDTSKNLLFEYDTGLYTDTALIHNNNSIIVTKPSKHIVKKGDTILSIASEYGVDTYQIISANSQLKKGKDYIIRYSKQEPAILESKLTEGIEITIPERYKVKKGAVKNFEDISKITGLSIEYLKDFLSVIEVSPTHPGEPDLTTYDDGFGAPTIGFGHTGSVDGKPLSLKKKITITNETALRLLTEDILKHKAMLLSYLGENNYNNAPPSVKSAIFDIAYNKGIWDGFLNPYHNSSTSKIKNDLSDNDYVNALFHTIRTGTKNNGLMRRNIYRFITGLTDLSENERETAINLMENYYKKVLNNLGTMEKFYLASAWNNAKDGKTTGYIIHSSQNNNIINTIDYLLPVLLPTISDIQGK